jgi:hypothetical protein
MKGVLLVLLCIGTLALAQSPRDSMSTILPEQLPQPGIALPIVSPTDLIEDTRNCGDFGSDGEWQPAQAFYNAVYTANWQAGKRVWRELDPHGLDRDVDGAACERNAGSPFAD